MLKMKQVEIEGKLFAVHQDGVVTSSGRVSLVQLSSTDLPPDPAEVEAAREFFRAYRSQRKYLNHKNTSVGITRIAEAWLGQSISNGACIEAALLEGLNVRRGVEGSD